jgi:hypothetical protein
MTLQTWSDCDFHSMGWHDRTVHGMHDFPQTAELRFDLDYITRWVQPVAPSTRFSFWLAPATLVFHRAHALHIEMGPPDFGSFVIRSVERTATAHDGVFDIHIHTLGGHLNVRASAVSQYLRAEPVHREAMYLELDARGGVCFDTPGKPAVE